MTIDEFKVVVNISRLEVYVKKDLRNQMYDAFLNKSGALIVPTSPIFSGHTKKSAIKKLKDWYHYEGRKNGNR